MSQPTKVAIEDRAVEALEVVCGQPGITAADLAGVIGIARSTATARLSTLQRAGWVTRQPGGTEGGRRLPDHFTISRRGTAVLESRARQAHSGRLARGELSSLVLTELAARSDPTSPAVLARSLDRSAGAVANALDRLVVEGAVALAQTAPRRYRVTSAGAAAGRWRNTP